MTLVLWRRQAKYRDPFWFEEGSPFLARLSDQLGDIPHNIRPLLWSGANSIFVRDKTARALAEHLAVEHTEHPHATQLVIAHSHGGNIVLRAMHHLQQRYASQLQGQESANPLVATLATPFVEVQHADFGDTPTRVRGATVLAVALAFFYLTKEVLPPVGEGFDFPTAILLLLPPTTLAVVGFLLGWVWIYQKAIARQNRVEALREATRLGELGSVQAQRLLVVRAVDDEASLILALGTGVNYLTSWSMKHTFKILLFSPIILAPLPILLLLVHRWLPGASDWYRNAVTLGLCALIFMLFGLLIVARSVHGWQLAVSPMECQVNTQSTPDAKGLSEIVTLIRRTYVKSLRHGIYDHEDCANTISDWVRFRLETN